MTRTLLNRLLFTIGITFLGVAGFPDMVMAKNGCDQRNIDAIQSHLDAGKIVIVIAMPAHHACDSEACGDWESYFTKVVSGKQNEIHAIFLETKKWPQVFSLKEPEFASSLFLKKQSQSYFYSGMILEPSVYEAVTQAWLGKTTAELAAFVPSKVDTAYCKQE